MLQDVFELKFAKMPEEPLQADPTPPPSVSGNIKSEEMERSILTSDEESDDHDDGTLSEEDREKRIKELQQLVGNLSIFVKIVCVLVHFWTSGTDEFLYHIMVRCRCRLFIPPPLCKCLGVGGGVIGIGLSVARLLSSRTFQAMILLNQGALQCDSLHILYDNVACSETVGTKVLKYR